MTIYKSKYYYKKSTESRSGFVCQKKDIELG